MSSKQPSNSTSDPTNSPEKSNNQIIKEAGFTGMHGMMLSYGLKMYNDDDVQEAKQIVAGFRALDKGQNPYGQVLLLFVMS